MKNSLCFVLVLLCTASLQAKKVKFAVDMTGQTVSVNGVHITGDFQAIAGLGANWDPASALLSKEGQTNIYSIIVNIPAFKKYEYRFQNGDQSYESEFVPDASRVGYDFVDNRWLYVDSLANDTTFVGAIVFGGNAPVGKTLVRYKIDINLTGNIPSVGVHVGTSYQAQAFDPTKKRLYSFVQGVFEIIDYVNTGTFSFIYYNGNTAGSTETVPTGCAVNARRSITITKDTVLPLVCFSSCAACLGTGIAENHISNPMKLYPNPASDNFYFSTATAAKYNLELKDLTGKTVLAQEGLGDNERINTSQLANGIYMVILTSNTGQRHASRLAVGK